MLFLFVKRNEKLYLLFSKRKQTFERWKNKANKIKEIDEKYLFSNVIKKQNFFLSSVEIFNNNIKIEKYENNSCFIEITKILPNTDVTGSEFISYYDLKGNIEFLDDDEIYYHYKIVKKYKER